jgi:hypothetical protein
MLGIRKPPVAASEGNTSQRPLGGIVRESNPAIFQETGKTIPSLQHVIDRLDDLGGSAERGALPFQPLVHIIEQRLDLFLLRGQTVGPIKIIGLQQPMDLAATEPRQPSGPDHRQMALANLLNAF